jgi:hypothetical protein
MLGDMVALSGGLTAVIAKLPRRGDVEMTGNYWHGRTPCQYHVVFFNFHIDQESHSFPCMIASILSTSCESKAMHWCHQSRSYSRAPHGLILAARYEQHSYS